MLVGCASSPATKQYRSDNHRIADQASQKIIDQCWDISQELRDSINTSDQREGALKSGLCMQKHIKYLFNTYLFTKDHNKDIEIQSLENLEKLHSSYARLYWDMYNSHDKASCIDINEDGVCNCLNDMCMVGLIYQSFHNLRHAALMESMMKDTYEILLDRRIVSKEKMLSGL